MRPDVTPVYFPLALWEARRVDVVHVTGVFSITSMQATAATLAAGRPAVLSARGSLEPASLAFGRSRDKRLWLGACRPLMERVTVFHATSSKEADSIRAVMGEGAPVRIVPNGVDLPPLRPRTEPSREPREPVIGFIGRVHRVKAIERLVDAASILKARGLRFRLHIAGPTPDAAYRRELESQITRLGLEGVAALVGELRGEAKVGFYDAIRVGVLPSFGTENFGNVVPEALSHGVPVVASRCTPWAELEETRCGRWVDNTPADLAGAIEPYLLSPGLARDHGMRGRELVERRYTWERVARLMIEVYRDAIAQRRDRS
jgi:glycosyltransferase involved in cell wall biosynthesis